MEIALVGSALALGLAGAPHCVGMCAAPCEMAIGHGGLTARCSFHLMRIAGYAVAGAVAAASVNALGLLGALSPMFKPLWTLLHAAALALGLWLAIAGRQPAWLENIGRQRSSAQASRSQWVPMKGPLRGAATGAAWVAWPCGLLQSAVLVAALANSPAGGATVMASFGAATSLGLIAGPVLWRRVGAGRVSVAAGGVGVRLAGALLVLSSGWALGHGLWEAALAYCVA